MKEAYHRDMLAKIDALEEQMNAIQEQIKTSEDEAHRKEYQSHLAEYQAKRDELAGKLQEMSAAHEDAWHGHKNDADTLYGHLSKYMSKVYAKYTGSGGTGMF